MPSRAQLPLPLRLVRSFRALRLVRGGLAFARHALPRYPGREFVVDNGPSRYVCDLSSYIEWNLAVFTDYEGPEKKLFADVLRAGNRRVMLDIGANVGVHSLCFARVMRQVVAFEPNPEVFVRLQQNIALNADATVTSHCVGLGDVAGVLRFYQPAYENKGTGTFDEASAPHQYTTIDLPVARADDFIAQHGITGIDAVKIDVQGYEPNVLAGMADTLARCRPVIWVEVSEPTIAEFDRRGGLAAMMPSGYRMYRFKTTYRGFLFHHTRLEACVDLNPCDEGDYLLVPPGYPM
jgi:FkbM family methyltransferase